MAAGTDDIRHIAALAKLSFSDEELAELGKEMRAILSYVARLSEARLDGVDAAFALFRRDNVFREDSVGEMLKPDDVLSNAPDRDGNLFRVPGFMPEG